MVPVSQPRWSLMGSSENHASIFHTVGQKRTSGSRREININLEPPQTGDGASIAGTPICLFLQS